MIYLRAEYYKIKKSWQSLLGYILVIALVVSVVIGFKIRANFTVSSLDIVLISLSNILNSFILHFIMALVTSLLFAGEFVNKTYKYIMIRPISLFQLIISKFLAIWYYCSKLLIFIALISLGLGIIIWGGGKVHGQNNIVLNNGLLRIILFYISTWINLIFVIVLGIFFSIIFKNQVSTVIATMGFFLILVPTVNIFPEMLEYTPLIFFDLHSFLSGINIQWAKLTTAIIINIFYSMGIIVVSYLYLSSKDILD